MAVVTRGGKKRPFKEEGRKPIGKCFQSAMRDRAFQGIGHSVSGAPLGNTVKHDGDAQGRGLYHGYKIGKRTGVRFKKTPKGKKGEKLGARGKEK